MISIPGKLLKARLAFSITPLVIMPILRLFDNTSLSVERQAISLSAILVFGSILDKSSRIRISLFLANLERRELMANFFCFW